MMNHFAFYSPEQMFIYKKTHSQAGFYFYVLHNYSKKKPSPGGGGDAA